MLRSSNPTAAVSAARSGKTPPASRFALVAVAVVAMLVLLLVAPTAQAAPAVDSSTAVASPAHAWTVFDLGWWTQTVQKLFAGSGAEADEGVGLDPHGINSPPEEPATSTSTDDSTPDREDGVGLDPHG